MDSQDLHRFGDEADTSEAAWRAIRQLELGLRPQPGDTAALLVEVIVRRNPEITLRLARMRTRPMQ